MDEKETLEVKITDDVGQFAETYSSFNKIVNKLQRQYLSLKETYTRQSSELQSVNKTLQSLMGENRAVTEFLNSILNSLSSGVIAIDASGTISHMNPAARKMLGITKDNFRREKVRYDDLMQAVENPECSAVETIRSGHPVDGEEKTIKTHSGTVLTLSVSTSLLKNRSGEIVGAVELFHDVSRIKKMEEQLSQMKVLASLGEMAASIAHEVRNPLAGIACFASLLARDLGEEPGKKEMADKIAEGVDSINNTIQTLLDFARKEKVDKCIIDLNTYLNQLLDNLSGEYAGEDLVNRVERDFSESCHVAVELDQQLFKQAIYNLVKNGLESGRGESRVWVRTREVPLLRAQKEYAGRLELSGTQTLAEITVEDNGPGIPEEDIGRLFSPFYSTKENGIGLGLSIAWKIVKAHGGDITAECRAEKGTRFSIVLPIRNA